VNQNHAIDIPIFVYWLMSHHILLHVLSTLRYLLNESGSRVHKEILNVANPVEQQNIVPMAE